MNYHDDYYRHDDFKLRRKLLSRAFGRLTPVGVEDIVFDDKTISMAFLRTIGLPASPFSLMEDYATGFNQVSVPLPTVSRVLDKIEIPTPENIGVFPCLDYRSGQVYYIDCHERGAIYVNDLDTNNSLFVNSSIEQMLVSWALFIEIGDSESELSKDVDIPREAFEQLLRQIDPKAIEDPDKTWWGIIHSDDMIWE